MALSALMMVAGSTISCRSTDKLAAKLRERGANRPEIIRALAKTRDVKALPPLLSEYNCGEGGGSMPAAHEALVEMKDLLIANAAESLLSDACGASKLFAEFGDQRAVPALIDALDSTAFRAPEFAAEALGMLKDPRAVEPLLRAVVGPHASQRMIEALGRIGDIRALSLLERIFTEGSHECAASQQEAATALGRMPDARAIRLLLQAASSSNAELRICALHGLAMNRSAEAVAAFRASVLRHK